MNGTVQTGVPTAELRWGKPFYDWEQGRQCCTRHWNKEGTKPTLNLSLNLSSPRFTFGISIRNAEFDKSRSVSQPTFQRMSRPEREKQRRPSVSNVELEHGAATVHGRFTCRTRSRSRACTVPCGRPCPQPRRGSTVERENTHGSTGSVRGNLGARSVRCTQT